MAARRMLFHRDFRGYTGGHGKVWDYFNHALALGWDARVYLTPESITEDNPWLSMPERIIPRSTTEGADVLFLAGMDWQSVGDGYEHHPPGTPLPPVINLVQGLRHAAVDPSLPLRGFLSRPATRICVSKAVAEAITDTGLVNGPVCVIPAALNLPAIDTSSNVQVDVFVGALKQPEFGADLGERLRSAGYRVDVCAAPLPRNEYLVRSAQARVCVMLPLESEGFYLPGLEAMALGSLLVMPDCGGSREYARNGENCLMPVRSLDAMAAAVTQLENPAIASRLIAQSRATAARYTLESEARAFGTVLTEMGLTEMGLD